MNFVVKMDKSLEEFYIFENVLAKTNGSILLKVQNKINQKIYIIKKIFCQNKDYEDLIILEIKILKLLKENNYTIQFETAYKDNINYYIITEYLDSYITIHEYIKNFEISNENASTIFDNLLLGLKSIHDLNIVHRDIKPDNIMINPTTLNIKYIDFGLSDIPETFENTVHYLGTPDYINVKLFEIDDLEDYTFNSLKNSDLFSLGVLFYCLLTKHTFLNKYIRSIFNGESISYVYQQFDEYEHFQLSPIYRGYLINFLTNYNTWKNDLKLIKVNEYRERNNLNPINLDNLILSDLQSEPQYT